jgi:hypothetical protein
VPPCLVEVALSGEPAHARQCSKAVLALLSLNRSLVVVLNEVVDVNHLGVDLFLLFHTLLFFHYFCPHLKVLNVGSRLHVALGLSAFLRRDSA